MAVFNYNRDIPDGPNNPSRDQPKMKINTNSTDDLISEDHYSFEEGNNNGFHKQVRMPDLLAIPTMIATSGGLYIKNANGRSQLFYTNETSGNEYQLTRVNNADFPTFSTNTLYQANRNGGWTFLPGGMLLQYGLTAVQQNVQDININFPKTFSNVPFSVTFTPARDTGTSPGSTYQFNLDISNLTTGSFRIKNHSTHAYRFSWMAIGV